MAFGFLLGALNAALIHYFRIISIVVTIATFNVFFGFLMFFTRGVSIYDLPDWWLDRVILFEYETASGDFAEITLPVIATMITVLATWALLRRLTVGRQLFALGDNPEGGATDRGQHRRDALPRLWMARDLRRCSGAHASALRAGSGPERTLRPRARRAGRGGPRGGLASAAAGGRSSA